MTGYGTALAELFKLFGLLLNPRAIKARRDLAKEAYRKKALSIAVKIHRLIKVKDKAKSRYWEYYQNKIDRLWDEFERLLAKE